MSEKTGTVTLGELPEKEIFIELEDSDKMNIKKEIRKLEKFSKFLTENGLRDWFYNKTKKLRLDKFKKLSKVIDTSNIKIKEISGKQGLSIKYPRFPFDFTMREGVRFVACILGDGCVHEKGVRYYNKVEILVDEFVGFSKKIFGNSLYKKYKNKTEIIISLPKIVKMIIECIGFKPGPKISTDPRIPQFIFTLSEYKKFEFVSQFIDDDGYINDGNIGIDLGFDENKEPLLIYDLRKLLKGLRINCSVFPASEYHSLDDKKRRMWRLGIFTFKDAKRLAQNLKLINPNKIERSKDLLNLKRKEIYKNLDAYLQKIKAEKMGAFTVVDLAKISNRSIRHSRRIVNTGKKLGLIKLVKPARGRDKRSYAVYEVVK